MTANDGAALGPITIELIRLGDDAPDRDPAGIGVHVTFDGVALRIVNVFPGGGAFDAGMRDGDRILAVDGALVAALGLAGATDRIRGAAGTTVTLSLQRDGHPLRLIVERRKLRA